MKKDVWLINHYATEMFETQGGRHYNFAINLKKKGYRPVIICASFLHKGTKNYIEEKDQRFIIKEREGIPFVFIKTGSYFGNGKQRIKNMIEFSVGLLRSYRALMKKLKKPDVIIASSVHPFTCVAGIIISKKIHCKIITEIRDLWPETLVMLGALKEKSMIARILYYGERWIYKRSDAIVFTMEGGKQYIIDRGWNKTIDLKKVYYINNGIDLEQFDQQVESVYFFDVDLESNAFKIIYTGTISRANDIGRIVKAAGEVQKIYGNKIMFLIYGQGDEQAILEKYCLDYKIQNVKFKGRVPKKNIPYILSKGNILIVNYAKEIFESKHNVLRYGGSHNKLFEYIAAGKPVLYTQPSAYNLVEKYRCGLVLKENNSVDGLVQGIIKMYKLDKEEYKEMCENSRVASQDFEFSQLTQKLITVIEK